MGTSRGQGRSGFLPARPVAAPGPRLRARRLARLVLAVALLAVAVFTLPWSRKAIDSTLVLMDLAAGTGFSPLKALTPVPLRTEVRSPGNGGLLEADLYLPGTGKPRAGVVLVPGVVPLGNRDPRLVAFAQTLARAGFAVLAPALPGYRARQVSPADAQRVAAAFRHLTSNPRWAPQGRAGMVAFSYAVGFTVLAALQPAIREQVRFIVGIGGYYDLTDVVTYATTGYFRVHGRRVYRPPDPYAQWVFLESARPYLTNAEDRFLLGEMARMKLGNLDADITPLARDLGAEGMSVYRLLTNRDPARVPACLAALPEPVRAALEALSLHNKDLRALPARLILVAGEDDAIIPYAQSLELARAVSFGRARVFVIHRVLGHVELRLARVFSKAFWREDVSDLWRLQRAVHLLLQEQRRG